MRSRALLAIALSVGFYVLALSVVALLLGIVYEVVIHAEWRFLKVVIACVIAALAILRSILPTREKFEPPGPRLERSGAPQLFEHIEDIALQTGQEAPSEIYLIPEMNAWVMQRGAFLGVGGHRVLAVGYPMLQSMSVSQLRAVLAHEFGHFCAADTKLSPVVYRTTRSVGRTLHALRQARSHVHVLFEWYGTLYLRITSQISRRQELAADELSAKVAGKTAAIGALQTLHRVAVPAELFWHQEVAPVVHAGHRPQLTEGLKLFLSRPHVQSLMSARIVASDETPDEYDTHPPLAQRLKALEAMTFDQTTANEELAIGLLRDFQSCEAAMMSFMFGVDGATLKPLEWNNVSTEIYIPLWSSWLKGQESALGTITIDEIPAAFAPDSLFLRKFADPPGTIPTREERRSRARVVLSGALALALYEHGWALDCSPGVCELKNGNGVIEPFDAITKILSGEINAEQWRQRCRELGLTNLVLNQKELSAPA